jgi:Mce-associated membrane protein
MPTNTSRRTPPETHSEATDAPTVDLDGTDATAKPETDDTADIDDHTSTGGVRSWRRIRPQRLAVLVNLLMAVGLAALIGVLGVRAYHSRQSEDLRALYLQVGRQGAVNLTTIDWHHADADVQRILAAATGTFYDDFSQRSQPFIDIVKKVQSTSTGTVSAAGLESSTDTDAQALVAVSEQTTTAEAPQQTPRAWRMRISVHKVGNEVKVSNVEFVP